VSDRRFADQGHAYINYSVTNGRLPTQNSSDLKRVIENAPRISPKDETLASLGIKAIGSTESKSKSNHSNVGVTRIVVISLVVLPVVFFVAGKLLNNKKKV